MLNRDKIVVVDLKRKMYFDSNFVPSGWNFECLIEYTDTYKIYCFNNSSSIVYFFNLKDIIIYVNPSISLYETIVSNDNLLLINDDYRYIEV